MKKYYKEFEDLHRGARSLILQRLSVYKPFVEILKEQQPGFQALDLGSGRGEWLELLSALDVPALGIDLDQRMIDFCISNNLQAHYFDAISYLKSRQNESFGLISAFHLIEHLSYSSQVELIDEAYRCLTPGGLLILETPNPENIVVATCNFYLDPTHVRVIPPSLLHFIVKKSGFDSSTIMRLQEDIGLRQGADITILDVLAGISRDYAVVSQKKSAVEAHENKMIALMSREIGVDLPAAAKIFTDNQSNRMLTISSRLEALEDKIISTEINIKNQADHNKMLEFRLQSVLSSTSWRLTLPLRASKKIIAKLVLLCREQLSNLAKRVIVGGEYFTRKSPMLRKISISTLRFFGVYERVYKFHLKQIKTQTFNLGGEHKFSYRDLSVSAKQVHQKLGEEILKIKSK